jgi:hypothetical protein
MAMFSDLGSMRPTAATQSGKVEEGGGRGGLVEEAWGWLRTMLMMETARTAAAMEGRVRDFMGDGEMGRERVRRRWS